MSEEVLTEDGEACFNSLADLLGMNSENLRQELNPYFERIKVLPQHATTQDLRTVTAMYLEEIFSNPFQKNDLWKGFLFDA